MKWLRIVFAAATSAAIGAACSSFDEPPPTSDDAGAGDASSDGPIGSNDGSTQNDGGGDLDAADAAADSGAACMPKPSGCDGGIVTKLDFDTEAVPVGWSTDLDNGSVVRVPKPGPCSSADGFLRATTSIPDADTSGTAYMAKDFTASGGFKTAHVAFAFRGPKPVNNGYANVGCSLVLRGAGGVNPRTTVRLTLQDDKLRFGATVRGADGGIVTNGPDQNLDQAFAAASGEWHRLDAKLVIQTNMVTLSTSYDGKSIGDFSPSLITPATRIDIECGIGYSEEPRTSYEHDIDDAFVELCP